MGEEEERTKVQSQDLIGVMDRRGDPRREKGSRMAGGLIQRGFCRGHDCVIDVGVSSRKFKHREAKQLEPQEHNFNATNKYG
jgi:hypothetical protein